MSEQDQTFKSKERIALDVSLGAMLDQGLSGARMRQAIEDVLAEANAKAASDAISAQVAPSPRSTLPT